MNVRSIHLRDFRRFEDRRIELDHRVFLISGRNGSGKTTLLDAIAAAMGSVVETLGVPSRRVLTSDVRRGAETDRDPGAGPPVSTVEIAAYVGSERRSWARASTPGDSLLDGLDTLEIWPVLAYHGGIAHPMESAELDERKAAYVNCFEIGDPGLAVHARLAILVEESAASAASAGALRAVESALTQCIGDSDPVTLSLLEGVLHISVGEAAPTPFLELSGASLRVASLFADIALRCAALNPQRDALAETPGVVLVEHLEAGLHPRWQRYLIDDFRRVFPRIQLIATTESPFLLQSLHAGDYLDLDGRRSADVSRMSLEDIAEEVLGVRVPQRSKRFHDMQRAAAEVTALVRSGANADSKEKIVLKARMNEKMAPFSDDAAWTAQMRFQRVAAGLEDDEDEP